MGSNKPANPIISVLAAMVMLLVLFGLVREIAFIQSENANARPHAELTHLSAEAKIEDKGGSQLVTANDFKRSDRQLEENSSDSKSMEQKNLTE